MGRKSDIPESEYPIIAAKYSEGVNALDLAAVYEVNRGVIYRILFKQGVPRNHKGGNVPLPPEQVEMICQRYRNKEGATTIARSMGVDKKTVYNILARAGIGTRPKHNRVGDEYHFAPAQERWFMRKRDGRKRGPKLAINEHAFDVLTPEASYWIGYLLTDGCIVSDMGRSDKVSINQSAAHREQVEKLKKFLGSDHAITDGEHNSFGKIYKHCTFQATAPYLCSVLARYGVVPNKTKTVKAVPEMENNSDFWRGVVDGDGSVYIDAIYMNSSSPKLANQFRRYIRRECKIEPKWYYNNKNRVWRVCVVAIEHARKVACILYSNVSITTTLPDKWGRAKVKLLK